MLIAITGYLGENRALHPLLLPDGVGVVSTNQKPGRGDLRPWNAPLNRATVPAGRQTIYRMGRDVASDTTYWLSWPSVVHVVCAPNAADTAERTYYSGGAAFAPKWTNTTLALAAAPYPSAYRELGVPAPTTACILTATPIAAITAGSFVAGTTYTIVSAGTTDFTLIGATNNTVGTAFTATGVGSGTGTARVKGETVTRAYTYTYVTDIGEESAPNASPTLITCLSNDTITVSNLGTAAPSGAYGITAKRVYRTQSGSSGSTDYYRAVNATDIAIGTASVDDTQVYTGEVLPTTTWLPPPTDLSWLTGLWNGMMAGISGRAIRFCEAFTFYAWPIAYEVLPTNAQPVALATYGQTLVMLTNGNPSIITGGTPDAMDEQPVEFAQACIAPLSAVGVGHGVVWASPDGLAYIGASGARMLTEGVMTRDDWQAINPSSIRGCFYERRYFGFYTVDGARKAFMFDFQNPHGVYFMDFGADAVYLDELQDALYVLDGVNVQKWDAGSPKTVTFKSKVFKLPNPMSAFGCAEVLADAYPVTFKLYADGVLKHTQTVADANPFRLPAGYRAQSVQVELSGVNPVQGCVVAHSMSELARA